MTGEISRKTRASRVRAPLTLPRGARDARVPARQAAAHLPVDGPIGGPQVAVLVEPPPRPTGLDYLAAQHRPLHRGRRRPRRHHPRRHSAVLRPAQPRRRCPSSHHRVRRHRRLQAQRPDRHRPLNERIMTPTNSNPNSDGPNHDNPPSPLVLATLLASGACRWSRRI